MIKLMVAVNDFNLEAQRPSVDEAVREALERIRLRMMELTLEPNRMALRQAAAEVFGDGITPQLAEALRQELHRWNEAISHLYSIEPVLYGRRDLPDTPARGAASDRLAVLSRDLG
jgi:hypothetical protein